MGIPLDYEAASSRAERILKPDPSAAARSTIRRQNAVRRPRRNGVSSGSSRYARSPSSRWPMPHVLEALTRESERELSDGDARNSHPSPPPLTAPGHWDSSTSLQRREMGQHLLRDSLRYSSPGRRMRIPSESSLRYEMPPVFWYGDFPQPVAPPAPRPNSAAASGRASLTPRFAPAYPAPGEVPSRSSTVSPVTTATEGAESNMPLLRRVGHRSVASARERHPPGRQEVDGLGDRERSPGPEEDEMHDSWETLLTTITPDDHLPSRDSSFTSATATASSALSRNSGLSNPASASQTPLTSFGSDSPGFRLSFAELLPAPHCDFPSSDSDSDTEPESEFEATPELPSAMFGFALASASRRREAERGRERQSQRRDDSTGDERTPGTSTNASFSTVSVPPDLQEVHTILDRLVRRDDIPDEWWATAGLSRTIRRELNSTSSGNRDD